MELSFKELQKREVINLSDGRSLGKITDIRLSFPRGVLIGITVPGRRVRGILRLFDKSEVYIDESRVVKIGGDVILVDLKCSDQCTEGRPPKPYGGKRGAEGSCNNDSVRGDEY